MPIADKPVLTVLHSYRIGIVLPLRNMPRSTPEASRAVEMVGDTLIHNSSSSSSNSKKQNPPRSSTEASQGEKCCSTPGVRLIIMTARYGTQTQCNHVTVAPLRVSRC